MRFESLLWWVLAMFLAASTWEPQIVVGGVAAAPEFQAADSGADIPPPR